MQDILKDIGKRCGGDIYLGVVGPVRAGKSSFIKRFMEIAVIPYIEDSDAKLRAVDELPQSGEGRMIMTVEPKFIPNQAAHIHIDDYLSVNVRLVDCVGYVIDGAKGYQDDSGIRQVKTPWYLESIPFDEAARIGTKKVIQDHSTIGIVVTCDGTICEIDGKEYKQATDDIINELKTIGKPFVIVVNSKDPRSSACHELVEDLKQKHQVPTIPLKVNEMIENDIIHLLKEALFEFPIQQVKIEVPRWIALMDTTHWLKQTLDQALEQSISSIHRFRDVEIIADNMSQFDFIKKANLISVDTSTSSATLRIQERKGLYNEILNEILEQDHFDAALFLHQVTILKQKAQEYETYQSAIQMVKQTGYGYALPRKEDIELSEPEVIKQGPRYGMKLVSKASTIHMIKVDIESTFEPIIGSKEQAEAFIQYLENNGQNNKEAIFDCDVFGRKLGDLINEGMRMKLSSMNESACVRVHDILSKIVNKGKTNVIAIVL
ncbi:MAG: stage IV sporulation protein A [Erysipelotrichaceae bacterium]|nr:stage IV sporulation protein A [Erysipelotrichaceae bacterium]